MKTAARIMLVAALTISVGLHWAVMQSAAWVGMAVTYSVQTGSISQGLSETFDGEHPCAMCRAVDEGSKKTESKNESAPTQTIKVLKLDYFAISQTPVFIFQAPQTVDWLSLTQTAESRTLTPESPPPRSGMIA